MTVQARAAGWFACDHAVIPDDRRGMIVADRVVLGVADGRLATVEADSARFDEIRTGGTHLPGLTLPGLVNAHSHAFHRALRGRTHDGGGDFWSWRRQMYRAAEHLDPDRYHRLARAVFAEMALAGITCVGEFHYLHHQADGLPYADANAMGQALLHAGADVGIRITLLDTLYLTAGVDHDLHEPGLDPVQQRFSDGGVAAWARRLHDLRGPAVPAAKVGAALHSVRAVPPDAMAEAAQALRELGTHDPLVVHAHVAEQPAEVSATRRRHAATPVALLDRADLLGPDFTAVHAVWLDDDDVTLLGRSGSCVCACPTTERDLADGVVRADHLRDAGARLALGSDQHATIDLLEEARALELDLRLVTQQRGVLDPATLLAAATTGGARSLGWHDAGVIASGALADLCVVGLDSVRLAGIRRSDLLAGAVHAATATDVTHTIVAGEVVVADGAHRTLDVAAELAGAIGALDPQEPAR